MAGEKVINDQNFQIFVSDHLKFDFARQRQMRVHLSVKLTIFQKHNEFF